VGRVLAQPNKLIVTKSDVEWRCVAEGGRKTLLVFFFFFNTAV